MRSTHARTPPPRVQEPAMFDRGTRGWFLRTLFPLNLTAEPGVGSFAQPWATPYRGKKQWLEQESHQIADRRQTHRQCTWERLWYITRNGRGGTKANMSL